MAADVQVEVPAASVARAEDLEVPGASVADAQVALEVPAALAAREALAASVAEDPAAQEALAASQTYRLRTTTTRLTPAPYLPAVEAAAAQRVSFH